MRACFNTFETPYTINILSIFIYRYIHWAVEPAVSAFGAFVFINMHAQHAYFIEYAVYCTYGAQCRAEESPVGD